MAFRLSEGIKALATSARTAKGRLIILLGVLFSLIILLFLFHRMYQYARHSPGFCISCHQNDDLLFKWQNSRHKNIECGNCHVFSVLETNRLMFRIHGPTGSNPHINVSASWEKCSQCHWEQNVQYPSAPMVNQSEIHARHFIEEQIDCIKCHGRVAHDFLPDDTLCLGCHTGVSVHGKGMSALTCLNCHTDTAKNLRPDRDKCLFCHGGDDVRRRLRDENRVDIRFFEPEGAVVNAASQIDISPSSPMLFDCFECHKPHGNIRPSFGDCMECHRNIDQVGRHKVHIRDMGLACQRCHKPHQWKIGLEQASRQCSGCHAYRSPSQFLSR